MIQHNRLLWRKITQASEKIDQAQSAQELLKIAESMREITPLQFDRRDYLLYFGADLLLFITGFFLYRENGEGFFLFLLMLALFIAIILAIRFYRREKLPKQLSEKIFYRDLLFDNQITSIDPNVLPVNDLLQRFREFDRGNYRREIPELLKGSIDIGLTSIPFYYFHFHYVDEEIVEEKGSDGKPKNRKIYHHYHRYGLLLAPKFLKDNELPLLQITADRYLKERKSDYLPASLAFRKRFSLYTSEQHFAAKILTPTIVEQLLTQSEEFKNMNIELNQQLLIAFDNRDLIHAQQNYDLQHLDAFIAELQEKRELPQLQKITPLIKNLLFQLK